MPILKGVYSPATSSVDGYVTDMGAMATSIRDSRSMLTYSWADATARGAATGMSVNDRGYQIDTKITYRYDGTTWKAWESGWITLVNPVTSGFSSTGGTQTARYKYINGDIRLRGIATLGTSPTVNLPTITLPVAMDTSGGTAIMGNVLHSDAGVGSYPGYVQSATSTTAYLLSQTTSGTNVTQGIPSSTVPFTWGATDSINYDFTYPVA